MEQFDQARFYLERYRSSLASVDAEGLENATDRANAIIKAQKKFEERLRKEHKQKLQRKEDEA